MQSIERKVYTCTNVVSGGTPAEATRADALAATATNSAGREKVRQVRICRVAAAAAPFTSGVRSDRNTNQALERVFFQGQELCRAVCVVRDCTDASHHRRLCRHAEFAAHLYHVV